MEANKDGNDAWAHHNLEPPEVNEHGQIDWNSIWLYRRKQGVRQPRPHFTGDIFVDVPVIGEEAPASVVILQHPCALLDSNNELRSVLLAAKVINHVEVSRKDWLGNYDRMPLVIHESDPPQHQAAALDQLALIRSSDLVHTKRVACMEIEGVARLLQRWTNANARVIVPCWRFVKVIEAQFSEAEGMESWCTQRQQAGVKPAVALKEATAWLDEKNEDTGMPRREILKDPRSRKVLLRRMHQVAKEMSDFDQAEKARNKAERQAQQKVEGETETENS